MGPNGMHATDEALELYSTGRLYAPNVAPLEEHLLVCERCREALHDCDEYVRVMRAALAQVAEEPSHRSDVLQWFKDRLRHPALAGGVILCLTVVIIAILLTRDPAPDQYVAVALTSARGLEQAASSVAGAGIDLRAELTELPRLPSYSLTIANARGDIVWKAGCSAKGGLLEVRVSRRLPPGSYWIRINLPGNQGRLLREYPLRVE